MIELRVLGPLDLRSADGQPLPSVLSQPKRAAFLGYLALATPRGVHRRDSLLALFWPELDQEHARTALRQALHFLRKELGDETFITLGDDVGLNPERLWCDGVALESALDAGRLHEAVELYRGDLFAGVHVRETPTFEHWLDGERDRLRRRAFEAGWRLADSEGAAGNMVGAAHWANWAVALLPDDEPSVRRLIELLDRLGDRPGAVRAYEKLVRLLGREYELEPTAETSRLIQEIRLRVPALDAAQPEGSSALVVTDRTPQPRVRGRGAFAIAGLVAVVAGAMILPGVLRRAENNSPGDRTQNTVAVAYFKDLSTDPAHKYLADALAEEIASSLGRVPRLQVKSPAAVRFVQRAADDPRAIGSALNVRYVVEGSVRRVGDHVRVSVRLVKAADGFRAWGDDYDRPTADLLKIPEDIARDVAAGIAGALSPSERQAVSLRPTADVQAYDRYLQGNFYLAQRSVPGLTKARAAYEEAGRLDPGFDRALARLAYTYALSFTYNVPIPGIPRERVLERGLELTDRALRLTPASSDAWMARGHLLAERHTRTLEGVIPALERAISLDSANAEARHQYGWALTLVGRDSAAEASYRRALDLEPGRVNTLRELALCISLRDPQHALRLLDSALAIDPTFYQAYIARAWLELKLGDLTRARSAAEMALRLRERAGGAAALAMVELREHNIGRARSLIARHMAPPFEVDQGSIPIVLWELGDTAGALTLLEQIPRGARLWSNLRGTQFDGLRGEPRFQRVVETARPPGATP